MHCKTAALGRGASFLKNLLSSFHLLFLREESLIFNLTKTKNHGRESNFIYPVY